MEYFALFLLLMTSTAVVADINMHNPRGSNNRQDESGRERANARRLFDSQNNNRGGVNVGPFPGAMHYYAGSELRIQWANQHSCFDENNNCNIVIQYMCDDNLRDGTTAATPPATCSADDCDTNPRYGHHESLTYYQQCASRERNFGLFTGGRGFRMRNSATSTRQNNGGTRYGYECPEERDYYPYFGPTPWIDIAVITDRTDLCSFYQGESQNVKSKWACALPDSYWDTVRPWLFNSSVEPYLFNDKERCESTVFNLGGVEYQPEWREFPAHGVAAPDCLGAPWTRDNHQGNTIGGEFPEYVWTIPSLNDAKCTLRMRYNISTNDFDPWSTDHNDNPDRQVRSIGPREIYKDYVFAYENIPRGSKKIEAERRQYYFRDDPQVDVFNLYKEAKKFNLRLAIDVAQFGRTFQDRSHSFVIKERPSSVPADAKIHNINVRGKRGNLAQVYPSVEYDFVPDKLSINDGDYLHIQWTGSNNNPSNNAGQGRARTDRSNILPLMKRPYAEGNTGTLLTLGTNYPQKPCTQELWFDSREHLQQLALAGNFTIENTPGTTLDDADAYFNMGLLKPNRKGIFHYFSSRNNNFSNRDQKATVIFN